MIRFISGSRRQDDLRLAAMLDTGQRVEMRWEHAHAGVKPDSLPRGIALGMEYAADVHDKRWVAVLWDEEAQPEWVDAGWLKVIRGEGTGV